MKRLAHRTKERTKNIVRGFRDGVRETISRPDSPALPTSQDNDTTASIDPPANFTPQDADQVVTTTIIEERSESSTRSTFARTTNPQHDIAALYVAFVLNKSTDLRKLILEVVNLSKRSPNELVQPCIQFTTQLMEAWEAGRDGIDKAVTMFLKTIEDVNSGDSLETRIALRTITDSISEIKLVHPDISITAEKKHSSAFSTIIRGALGIALPMLDIIKEGSSMIPVPMVQPLIGVVAGFFKAADQAFCNIDSMRLLATAAAEYIVSIAVLCPQKTEERWERTIDTLEKRMYAIVKKAEEYASRNRFLLFLQQDRDKGDIETIKNELAQAISVFNLEIRLNIKHDLDDISGKIDTSLLISLPCLPFHDDSKYYYFASSREADISFALNWIADKSGKTFLWIHGAAGVGKSTLAQRLLVHVKGTGSLAAYAYFAVGLNDSPKRLVQMMARELFSLHPSCRRAIVDALRECAGENQSLAEYLAHFLFSPITSLSYTGPLVIILDALDEWEHHKQFLRDLCDLRLPSNLKIIMTSRYSDDIQSLVNLVAQSRILNPVSNAVCRAYFEDTFKDITWNGNEPGQVHFEKLVELADGLLIWAATVCSIVSSSENSDQEPIEILDNILASSSPSISDRESAKMEKMEVLYRTALERLYPDQTLQIQELREKVFLSMAALREALPLKDFARLVGVRSVAFLKTTCSKLRALQTRGTPDDDMVQPAIKLFHASFIYYLGGLKRARKVMAANCIHFFETVVKKDTVEPLPFPFRRTQLDMYMGKHWMGHMKEAQSNVTNDQLRLWAGWSLSRLLFLEDKHDHRPNSQELLSLSDVLLCPQGMTYSPEILCQDLLSIQTVVADFRQALDIWEILYHNPDYCYCQPDDIRHWALVLNGLAISLHQTHLITSDTTILDEAISVLEDLTAAYPRGGDQEYPTALHNLGRALHSRFESVCSRKDLERAVNLYTQARDLHLKDSLHYAISSLNLGRALHDRFQYCTSDPKDLEQAISLHRHALKLFQPFRSLLPASLYALGNSLQAYSLACGNSDCLKEAMLLFYDSTQVLPQSAYDLRLYAPRKAGLVEVLRTVAQHTQRPGFDSRKVQLVRLDQDHHMQIDLEKGTFVFKIIDPVLIVSSCPRLELTEYAKVDDACSFIQFAAYCRSLLVDGVQVSSAGSELIYRVSPEVVTAMTSVSSGSNSARTTQPTVESRQPAQHIGKGHQGNVEIYQPPNSMFGLIIGINHYQSPNFSSLRGAVPDACIIESYLKEYLLADDSRISMLLDQSATRNAIIDSLVALKKDPRIVRGDPILIYYAGHSMEVSGPDGWATESHILPYDYEPDRTHGISNRDFVRLIEEIVREKGDNITVILDCSHSASFGGLSHVLLAACSADEVATERQGHGAFTLSLVNALRAVPPDTITYIQLWGCLHDITHQNPQLVGNSNKRCTIFDRRVPQLVGNPYTLTLDNFGQYILDAGSAHGVCPDGEFTVYANHGGFPKVPKLGVMIPVEVNTFQTVMRPLSGPGPYLDKATSAYQTRAGALEELKVFTPLVDSPLIPALKKTLMQMNTFGFHRKITRVNDPSIAHLVVESENNEIIFIILDEHVTAHGITKYNLNTEEVDMMYVLRRVADYRYHLNRSYLTSENIENGINVEFFELDELVDVFPQLTRPSGENLLKHGIINLSLSDDVDNIFCIRITNPSTKDLYLSILYFDNHELSITQYFGFENPSHFKVDSPLPKNGGRLNLGVQYFMPYGQAADVGFLKCIFATSPIDLSEIETPPTTFRPISLWADRTQAVTSPVNLPNLAQTTPSNNLDGSSPLAMSDAWGCVVIPVVKRTATVSYQEPSYLGSPTPLGIEFSMTSDYFSNTGR